MTCETGVITKGTMFDAGLRWAIVVKRGRRRRIIAYTKAESDADQIVNALNAYRSN